MPLIKVYNNDSNTYGLKGHFTFRSVCNSEASRTATFGHHVQTASAEAVSSCRTFGDEAWSQQVVPVIALCGFGYEDTLFIITLLFSFIITVHVKIIMLMGTWSDHPGKQCYHKGIMGRPWLIN
jgi:hypothetical protein